MIKDFLRKRAEMKRLKNAFSIAGIYYSTSWDGKTIRNFPHVLDVRVKEDKSTYVFRLPHGVDPNELQKKSYVFRSMFGELIEFKGETVVSFTVYHKAHNGSYDYSFEELENYMVEHRLPIIAGKDINGRFQSYDMTMNPHLLIAGETGSGKSVMLRAILTSLIQYKRKGLQLHLADLKRSEFHLFRNVDIVKSVMTDKKDVKKCVSWFHDQMVKRGDLLDELEISHVDELPKDKRVDYLVLCIDEFSILREEKETMAQLTDLAALGRALGIYLILSTQRPDSKVIDGLLKANLTVRFAFRHADKTNSRITLGDGADKDASTINEKERGKFIMRFNGCHYLQSPHLTTERAKDILKGYKSPVTRKPVNEATEDIIDMIMKEEKPKVFGLLDEEEEK